MQLQQRNRVSLIVAHSGAMIVTNELQLTPNSKTKYAIRKVSKVIENLYYVAATVAAMPVKIVTATHKFIVIYPQHLKRVGTYSK